MKNGFFIIDAHCHIYPEKIAARAVHGTDTFYDTRAHGLGVAENLILMGKKAGISAFVVQSVATSPKQVSSINHFIAETVGKYPDTLWGLGTLHPDSDDMKRDVEEIVSLGLHGVKLHPDIQRFRVDEKRHFEMYRLCEEYRLPILIHAGDKRYNNSNPDNLLPVLSSFPSLTVVAAHMGGWSVWDEAAKKLARADNLYVDSSSSIMTIEKDEVLPGTQYLTPRKAREYVETFGTDRVLFGTDYPMWSPKAETDTFLSLGFTDEEYKKMFSENAKKAFRLN